jgi:hypothetical protein
MAQELGKGLKTGECNAIEGVEILIERKRRGKRPRE